MDGQSAARIRRRELLAGGVAAGLAWSAPSVTRVDVAAAQQSVAVACTDEPERCGRPFGSITQVAGIDAAGLSISHHWTEPVTGKLARIVAWALSCGATTHGDPVHESAGVPSTDLTSSIQLSDALLDGRCGTDGSLVVRTVLVWSVVGGGAHPLSVPGPAVFDVDLQRSGGAYAVAGSRQHSELDMACFPLHP